MFFERVQGNDVYNAALNPPFAYIATGQQRLLLQPQHQRVDWNYNHSDLSLRLDQYGVQLSASWNCEFSLGVQRQLAPSMVAVVQYVGSIGWDQNDDRADQHLAFDRSEQRSQSLRPSPGRFQRYAEREPVPNLSRLQLINQEENETNFNYNSFQIGMRMENRHGLTTQVAYTWSHEIDEVSNDLNGAVQSV